MLNYYTNTYDLMTAIKYNIRQYIANDSENLLSSIKSWNLGFVFPETLLPAITIFPISKTFLPRQSGGRTPVSYRFTIDIYSNKHKYLKDAKSFCLNLVEIIIRIIKSSNNFIDSDNKKHCFSTVVDASNILESKDSSDRGFISKATIEFYCNSLHQMNESRIIEETVKYVDINTFSEIIYEYIKKGISNPLKVSEWQYKIFKPISKYPAILIYPIDDNINDFFTNRIDLVTRSFGIYVVHKGYPKKELLKINMDLCDMIVESVEKNYSLGGAADYSNINSIEYNFSEIDSNFEFNSLIKVDYFTKREFNKL